MSLPDCSGRFQFVDRAPCLIDRLVRIGVPSRIGVGDGDAAAALAGDFIGLEPLGFRIEQRIGAVRIAVWSAIDRDRGDVAHCLKSARSQHTVELIDDPRFVFREWRVEQQLPA
jgi:hypothetical protein